MLKTRSDKRDKRTTSGVEGTPGDCDLLEAGEEMYGEEGKDYCVDSEPDDHWFYQGGGNG